MSHQSQIEFVPISPVAANADPHTSHVAARKVTRDGTRSKQAQRVYGELAKWSKSWGGAGCTSAELAALTGLDRHLVARRLPELADPKNGGLVERGEARTCRITGRLALTWWVAPEPTP